MSKKNVKLREIYCGEDYDSEFEFGTSRKKQKDNISPKRLKHISKPPSQSFSEECSKAQGHIQRFHFLAKDAYSRHKDMINNYLLCYPGASYKLKRKNVNFKSDIDVIRENHQFLWEDDEEAHTWGKQLAKKYYDKLFKEYCLTDLSRYKEKKLALRWRTEAEVIDGKGQFSCGNIHCNEGQNLTSWEVNFKYTEHEKTKNSLVKVRLCPDCSLKLNHHHSKKKVDKFPANNQTIKDYSMSCSSTSTCSVTKEAVDSGEKQKPVKDFNDPNIWKQQTSSIQQKSREDEFEQYLREMLL